MTDHISLAAANLMDFRQFSVNRRKEGRISRIRRPSVPVQSRPLQPYMYRLLFLSQCPIIFSFHYSRPLPVYLMSFYILVFCDRTFIHVLSDSFLFALVYAVFARISCVHLIWSRTFDRFLPHLRDHSFHTLRCKLPLLCLL